VSVLINVSPTAEDAAPRIPTDAPPSGTLTAASKITPDESLEQVTGLIEHISLPGAATNSSTVSAASCAHCGKEGELGVAIKRCTRCMQIAYCGADCQKAGWRFHKVMCAPPLPLNQVTGLIEHASLVGAATNSATAASTARSATCANCGKEGAPGVKPKQCGRCRRTSYCGAECQRAAWRLHKVVCGSLLSLDGVFEQMKSALDTADWPGMLKWEGRMEELLEIRTDEQREFLLWAFMTAHRMLHLESAAFDARMKAQACLVRGYPPSHHQRSCARLEERRLEILGRMQRFRDQGEAMCDVASSYAFVGQHNEAERWFQRARNVAEAHGFFSVECKACHGLGMSAIEDDRPEEGVELLRNA